MHSLTWVDGLMILGAFVASVIVGEVASRAAKWLSCRLFPKHSEIMNKVRGPVGLVAAVALWQGVLAFLELPEDARIAMHDAGRVILVLALVWLCLRVADLLIDALARRKVLAGHALGQSLLPIIRRVAKIVIVAVAVVAVLGSLGYSVTGLIAGLGIGGIAVALAAQKTLENVVGAFALGIDRPLQEGDFIRVDTTQGTVEQIGLRSTRVRTDDRTIVAIPNGKLADSIIERYTGRDRFRFYAKFRIGLSTRSKNLRAMRDAVEQMLASHPKRAQDTIRVHFNGPGDTWFDLEIMAWYDCKDMTEFRSLRDELFLNCLDIMATNGITLSGNSESPEVPMEDKPVLERQPVQPQPRPSRTAPTDRH